MPERGRRDGRLERLFILGEQDGEVIRKKIMGEGG